MNTYQIFKTDTVIVTFTASEVDAEEILDRFNSSPFESDYFEMEVI